MTLAEDAALLREEADFFTDRANKLMALATELDRRAWKKRRRADEIDPRPEREMKA